MVSERNRHHWIFPRKEMRTPTEKTLRSLYGFVLFVPIDLHSELHNTLEPPEKPLKQVQHDIIDFANGDYAGDEREANYRLRWFIGDLACRYTSDELAQSAFKFYEHLEQQAYILGVDNEQT